MSNKHQLIETINAKFCEKFCIELHVVATKLSNFAGAVVVTQCPRNDEFSLASSTVVFWLLLLLRVISN